MKYFCYLSVLVFFVFISVESKEQRHFKHLSIQDGLSQSYVTTIVQDDKGFMWFGTQDGLNRYDGKEFILVNRSSNPSLTDNYILNLIAIPNNEEMLFSTINGDLFWFNRLNGIVIKVDLAAFGIEKSGLFRDFIYDEVEESIWLIREQDGLFKYSLKTKTFKKMVINNSDALKTGRILIKGDDDILWIGTETGLVSYHINSDSIEELISNETQVEMLDSPIYAIAKSENGTVWLGTNSGLYYFDAKNKKKQVKVYKVEGKPLLNGRVTGILVLDNRIWISTINSGVFEIDVQTETYHNYRNELNNTYSLSSNYVHTLFKDKDETIWFSTSGFGLSKTDNRVNKVNHIKRGEKLTSLKNNMIRSFNEEEDGTIWIATGGGGIHRFNMQNNEFLMINPEVQKEFPLIWDIEKDINKRFLWLATDRGLVRFNKEKQTTEVLKLLNEPVIIANLYLHNDTTLVAGTIGKGMFIINPQTKSIKRFVRNAKVDGSIPNDFMFAFARHSDSQFWVGTYGGGLSLFSLENFTSIPFSTFSNGVKESDTKITTLKAFKAILFIGTSNGITVFNTNTKKVSYVSTAEGLANSYIYSVENDRFGYFWVSTNRGLSRVDFTKNGRDGILNFTPNEGLQSHEFNSNSSLLTKKGLLFFGGINGFNYFNPTKMQISNKHDTIAISKVTLNNEHVYPFFDSKNSTLVLTPNDLSISINLTSFNFSTANDSEFAYKLDGFDTKWVYIGNRFFIQFTNLNAGDYTLYVKGTNTDGVWSGEQKLLNLVVLPPFWLTWWFRSLLIIIFVSSLSVYVSRVQKRKNELQVAVLEKTKELSKSEALFRMISENVADTIIVMNSDLFVSYLSPSISRLLGYTVDYIYTLKIFELVHPDDYKRVKASVINAFHTNEILTIEFRMLHADGNYRIISVSTTTVFNDEKGNVQLIAIARDVTEIREYEAALVESKQAAIEANKAKSMFLAGMSHELRTPLNAILGFAQILQNDDEIPRRKRDFIQTMYKSGNHLLRMINDVLDFSKIEAGKQELKEQTFDFMSMCYELESMFSLDCQNKQLIFDFEFGSSVPRYIKSDPSKLQQILINLIGNAIKFTESGSVSFHVRAFNFKDNLRCTLQLRVADTGVGISDDHKMTIFEPFHQVDDEHKIGTGLGLSITSKLCEVIGGEISVESTIGKGSTFEIMLPIEYELVMDLEPNESGERWHYEGLNVLVVDDIPTNREMAKEMLQQHNMHVDVAESGKEAIEYVEQNLYDLILMDYLMPELNGKETMDEIRKIDSAKLTPIVVLTAFGLNKNGMEFLEMGFDGFLSKPLSKNELLNETARVVQMISKPDVNTQETLDQLSLQHVAAAILMTFDSEQEQWLESIEILDLDSIDDLLKRTTIKDEEILNELSRETKQRNYRYFISLQELVG